MTPQEMKTVNKKLLDKFANDKKNKVKEEITKNEDLNKRKEVNKQYTQVRIYNKHNNRNWKRI